MSLFKLNLAYRCLVFERLTQPVLMQEAQSYATVLN